MADNRQRLRDELKRDAEMMRELGIAKWVQSTGEIILREMPQAAPIARTLEERQAAEERKRHRQHEIMFASSNHRPKLQTSASKFDADTVVPRVGNAPRRDDAPQEQ